MSERQLVVFDFCETLVSFQSADRFVDRIALRYFPARNLRMNHFIRILKQLRILAIANKLFPKLNLNKRLVLLKIRGLKLQDLEEEARKYLDEEIIPGLNEVLIDRMLQHQRNNDHLIISSGGYHPYLILFCEKYGISPLFSSRIAVKNGRVTGFMEGADCMFTQKVTLLSKWTESEAISNLPKMCYTDSVTDMPLLRWADEAYVVSYSKPQKWVAENNFHEIIIHN